MWFVGCMVFVLAAVCEYAILLFLKRVLIRQRKISEKEQDDFNDFFNGTDSAPESAKDRPVKDAEPETDLRVKEYNKEVSYRESTECLGR